MSDIFTRELFAAATLALQVYDHCITFGTEVSAVWSSEWSIGLPLFYINRYMPLIDQSLLLYFVRGRPATVKACQQVFNSWLVLTILSANVSHVIIYLQTCALWSNRKPVIYGLGVLLLATAVSSVALMTMQMRTVTYFPPGPVPTPILTGCGMIIGQFYVQYLYIVVFVANLVTVGLMLYKGIQHVRQSSSPWVIELYQNGVLFCVVILVFSLANAIIPNINFLTTTTATLLAPLQHTMESVLCSRVMFVILRRRKAVLAKSSQRRRRRHSRQRRDDRDIHHDNDDGTNPRGRGTRGTTTGGVTTTCSSADGYTGTDSSVGIFTSIVPLPSQAESVLTDIEMASVGEAELSRGTSTTVGAGGWKAGAGSSSRCSGKDGGDGDDGGSVWEEKKGGVGSSLA